VDYVDLFESFFDRIASGGAAQVVTCNLRDAGEAGGQTGRDVEVWGQGCVVYRPAPPTDAGLCQGLAVRLGGQPVVIATRDNRASEATGDLSAGDAAFCSPTGKVALLAKADGSIALLKQAAPGVDSDSLIALEKDGAYVMRTPFGQMQMTADGFAVILLDGTCLSLSKEGGFTVIAPQACLETGTVKLGASASVPLSLAPTTGVAKPAPHIFV
jgi:hypothetical protein